MSRARPKIVGLGAMNVDFIVSAESLRPTVASAVRSRMVREAELATSDLDEFLAEVTEARTGACDELYGGSAYNVVRALAELDLGIELGFAGALGSPPRSLDLDLPSPRRQLEAMDIEFLGPAEYNGPGGMSLSLIDDAERSLRTFYDEAIPRTLSAAGSELAGPLGKADVVHVTSVFGEDGPRALADILRPVAALPDGPLISVDPGHAWAAEARPGNSIGELLQLASLVFVNVGELGSLGSPRSTVPSQVETALSRYMSAGAGPKLVLLKEWDRATMFELSQGEMRTHTAQNLVLAPSQIVDSTGAGDVFAAGVLAALASDRGHQAAALHLGLATARYKLRRRAGDGYEGLRRVVDSGPDAERGPVFFSYSGEDQELAEAVIELLECLGLSRGEDIFCTAVSDRGITIGDEPIAAMHRAIERASLVLSLISPAYLDSDFCRYETGAAWGLAKPTASLLVPPLEISELDDLIRSKQVGAVSDPGALDALVERLARMGLIDSPPPASWERWRQRLMDAVAAALARTA